MHVHTSYTTYAVRGIGVNCIFIYDTLKKPQSNPSNWWWRMSTRSRAWIKVYWNEISSHVISECVQWGGSRGLDLMDQHMHNAERIWSSLALWGFHGNASLRRWRCYQKEAEALNRIFLTWKWSLDFPVMTRYKQLFGTCYFKCVRQIVLILLVAYASCGYRFIFKFFWWRTQKWFLIVFFN